MFRLIISRVFGFVATMAVASVIVFLLLGVVPGHHAGTGPSSSPVSGPGSDLTPWQDIANSFGGLVRGDFGVSSLLGTPVAGATAAASLLTLTLALLALVIAVAIGLPLGVLAARRRGSPIGGILSLLTRLGVATPNFWLGMLLVLLSSALLHALPGGEAASPDSAPLAALGTLILPALALGLPLAAILARVMGETLLELRASDFIRTRVPRG